MEIMVVVGIIGILFAIAVGPFMSWYKKSKVEDRASSLHEAIKRAQTQAVTRGEVEVNSGVVMKKKMYLALNPTSNSYRVVEWRDVNNNNIKDAGEFTILSEATLNGATFGFVASVNKTACGNATNAAPANSMPNFTALSCPGDAVFTGFQCARFDGKGFLESMLNPAAYVTDLTESYAVSINPAGVSTLCRWSGTEWVFIR